MREQKDMLLRQVGEMLAEYKDILHLNDDFADEDQEVMLLMLWEFKSASYRGGTLVANNARARGTAPSHLAPLPKMIYI